MLVTGLLSVLKSSPPTHTSENSPKPEVSTSDSSQQTRHAENLPEVLTGHIDSFLDTVSTSEFSQTNKNNRRGSAEHFFRPRLKPEFRLDGRNYIKDYGDPAKRLDQYVPADPAGRNYLATLGISGVLTARKITEGRLTIRQALAINARIDTELAEYHWEPLEIELLNHPVVRDCVLADRVKVNIHVGSEQDALGLLLFSISRIKEQALINLSSPAIRKYLYSGDLNLLEALHMDSSTLAYLELPGTQAEFDSNPYVTMESFLA